MVDHIMPNEEEIMKFVHDIEFSDGFKPKLEIKEELIGSKSGSAGIKRKSEFMEETLKVKSSKLDQKPPEIVSKKANREQGLKIEESEFPKGATMFMADLSGKKDIKKFLMETFGCENNAFASIEKGQN